MRDQFTTPEELLNLNERPVTDIGMINYRRLTVLLPYLTAIAYIMHGISFIVGEINPLKNILMLLALFSTILLILVNIVKPIQGDPLQTKHHLILDSFCLLLLLWGASMLGFQSNALIPYFDFLIAVFSVGIILLIPAGKLLTMYAITFLYLVFLTPGVTTSNTNHILLIISVLLFMAFSFGLSRMYYKQFMHNIRLASLLYDQQINLSEMVKTKSAELAASQNNMAREVIRVLSKVLDDFDSYTRGHSENVARLAEHLARRLGLSDDFQQQLFWAGMIHDIGKIRVPKHILNKTTPLTDEEFAKIKKHPVYGYEMIHESEILRPLAQIVLSHHEFYDGSGHPNHLRGDQIPLAAQILSIADAWDAMLSRRIYRDALSIEHAISELIRCSGKQFSPSLVNAFLKLIEEEPDLKQPIHDFRD
ncbi:MAG: HD-GYP domain-containing protein [Eubacteriales bacterium]|nr:HD-GYP domain-containing protein [Eubacteriales bacterium]